MPYPALRDRGIVLRRGQISLWVAAPGVGKSVLMTNLCLRAKVPALYLSADSDQHTVVTRTIATLMDLPLFQVVANLDNPEAREWYDEHVMGHAAHVDFSFDSDVTLERVMMRLSAYAEINGDYPHLLVLDNLGDAVASADLKDKYPELERIVSELKKAARHTKTHIAMVHHATGEYEDGNKMIPLGGVIGKMGKLPEQVFTLWNAGYNELGVFAAKNRNGEPRISASLPVRYDRARVDGFDL